MTARVLAAVWVSGVPRTQGSMEHIGRGRMKHSDAMVRWRSLVRDEIARGARLRGYEETAGIAVTTGPVAVRCVFVRGDGQGDIDKLARCVLDALTESRVIADDVQVVKLHCDRVERIQGRGDGVFVLVVPFGDNAPGNIGAEIEGWVGP